MGILNLSTKSDLSLGVAIRYVHLLQEPKLHHVDEDSKEMDKTNTTSFLCYLYLTKYSNPVPRFQLLVSVAEGWGRSWGKGVTVPGVWSGGVWFPPWTGQTSVKTLPSRNFVCGR